MPLFSINISVVYETLRETIDTYELKGRIIYHQMSYAFLYSKTSVGVMDRTIMDDAIN